MTFLDLWRADRRHRAMILARNDRVVLIQVSILHVASDCSIAQRASAIAHPMGGEGRVYSSRTQMAKRKMRPILAYDANCLNVLASVG